MGLGLRVGRRLKPRVKKRKGSALLITLLVITTLTGLTLGFSEDSGIELTLAGYSRDGFRAYQAARSGVHLAMALLDQEENKDVDSLSEEWADFENLPLPVEFPEDVRLSVRIVDESGKVSVNSLVGETGDIDKAASEQLYRLFYVLGLSEEALSALMDWLDGDSIERLDGAEDYYYRSLPTPYECADGPILTPAQIFLVKGFKGTERLEEKERGDILDYVTIYSDGKLNINTASKEALESLSERVDSSLAEAIVEYRLEEEFLLPEDLKNVPGVDDEIYGEIQGRISVKSTAFSFDARAECGEAVARIRAVATRESDRTKLIYWQVN